MDWDRVYVAVWYGLVIVVLALEGYTLLDGRTTTPPLTAVIVREVPWWITIPFLAWMLVHFASRYLGKPVL